MSAKFRNLRERDKSFIKITSGSRETELHVLKQWIIYTHTINIVMKSELSNGLGCMVHNNK